MKHNAARANKDVFQPKVVSWRDWPLWVKATLGLTLILRLAFLEWKSPHFDESINGHFVNQIWLNGFFQYDPTNFHGPLYFYLLHLTETLLGRGILAFRFLTGLLSVAVVGVVAMHARYLGRAAFIAALIAAVSPAMVFYGRYAIHETLLILGQVVFTYGFLKWRLEGGRSSIFMMIAGTVVAAATKETFFIFLGTWLIAVFLLKPKLRFLPVHTPVPKAKPAGGREVWFWGAGFGVLALCALFSGFFIYPKGIQDMIAAFAFWTKTGTGATGHEKPFLYWLELLARYEWPVLLALAAAPVTMWMGSVWLRLFALTGFGLWLAYSIIPYKTPWCVIGFVWPLALSLGLLFDEAKTILRPRFVRQVGAVAVGVALAVSFVTALRISFRDYEKAGEPYVYVQTTQDVNLVTRALKNRVRLRPEDRNARIQVLSKDPWPLPWLLSFYPNTEFASAATASAIEGVLVLVDETDAPAIEAKLKGRYLKRRFSMRDSYAPGFAYFKETTFGGLIPQPYTFVGAE